MSYSVRYQVFVSSTFTDLVEERAEVIQAIWELDCIPTGMEAFVASNESQWDVISRVISEGDYYVLILGGRYGSVTTDGVSYTEKEFKLARKLGIPVLAFVHGNPDEIPIGKSEKDEALRGRLNAFRAEVMNLYPIRTWMNASELGGHVSRSLIREIKINPRPGWIRNDGSSPIALLEQINSLSEENRELRNNIEVVEDDRPDQSLQQNDDEFELFGTCKVGSPGLWQSTDYSWSLLVTWNEVYRDVGPALLGESSETNIKAILARFHLLADAPDGKELREPVAIAPESYNEVLIQLRALGLIAPGIKKRGVNDRHSYWRITPAGDKYLVGLLAKKRKPQDQPSTG